MRHLHNLFGGLACSETLHGHAWCTNTKWQTADLLIQWNTADMCSSRLYLDSLAWFRPRIFFKLIESPTKKPVVPPSHSVIFLFLRLFIFCPPTFSTPSLFFRLTLELNVSFLVAPHCRVSATSQAYSLWKLFSPEQTAHFFFFCRLHKANGQLMSNRASLAHNSVGTVQSKYINILYPYRWSPTSTDLCPPPHKTFMFLFVYVEPAEIKPHSVSPSDL